MFQVSFTQTSKIAGNWQPVVFPSLLFADGPRSGVCTQWSLSPRWWPASWRTGGARARLAAHLAWFLAGLVSCVPAGRPREGSRPLAHSRGLTRCPQQVADGSEIDPCCILDSFLPLVFVCMVVMVGLQSCKKLCFPRNNSDLLLLKKREQREREGDWRGKNKWCLRTCTLRGQNHTLLQDSFLFATANCHSKENRNASVISDCRRTTKASSG